MALILTLVVVLGTGALAGGVYLAWYGGFGGPIDRWLGSERHGPRDAPRIALTFDDGPDPAHTPALLDALAELRVPATFFVVGRAVEAHPALCARMVREGHEIGNHTYSHRYLPLAGRASVEAELRATDLAIARATQTTQTTQVGQVTGLARPPYGARRRSTVRTFARLAKRFVLWDVNSFDWKGAPPPEIAARVVERVRPGSIVLLHEARDGGAETVAAVRLLVPALRARGYELATASGVLRTPQCI